MEHKALSQLQMCHLTLSEIIAINRYAFIPIVSSVLCTVTSSEMMELVQIVPLEAPFLVK